MNKYIFKLGLICLAMILFQGCFDLDHEEYENISSENFPTTQEDLEAALVGCYKNLGETYIMDALDNAGLTLNELCTDEMNTAWGHVWEITHRLAWAPNNNPALTVYERYNKAITKATRIIDAFSKADIDEKDRTKFVAELRVLRAFYANAIYSLFGPLPVVTDPDVANDIYSEYEPVRPSREEYVAYMITELESVYNDLENRSSSENWGRMDKGTALTLLMKIYLDAKMFDKANETADKIIALGIYELLPGYESVFDIENEGPGNKEVIFPIGKVVSNTSYAWTYFACVMPSTPKYKTKTGVEMTVWGGLKMPWEYYDKYEEGDERLNTIIRYYEDVDGNQVDFREVQDTKAVGAIPMKYSEDPNHRGQFQGNDFVVFRYADVLLSKAEALNEIHGPTAESVALINQIRRRVKASEIKLADYNTKEMLRDFILEERGRELYNEGHRRNDLIRHGKFVERAIARGIDAKAHHVLYPIPQSAINENPNLKQNPGYEN